MSVDKTAKALLEAMQGKSGPEGYDTQATVMRVEDDILWVHIPGGVDETPVKKTVGASAGDLIQIRVSGGRAFAVGNASAPPTDDRQALIATQKAESNAKVLAGVVENVQKTGASITNLGDQIQLVVTELDEKNTTYSAGIGTAYIQLCTKAGDPICTKAGDPIMAKVRIPYGTSVDKFTVGDLWYNTDEDNAVYRWNGSYWESAADQRISEISQKLDSITLRVVGSDGTVSEIALNDQGQINLLGSVIAERLSVEELFARDITATGTFQVINGSMYLVVSETGFNFRSGPNETNGGMLVSGTDVSLIGNHVYVNGYTSAQVSGHAASLIGDFQADISSEAVTIDGTSVTINGSTTINGNPPVTKRTKTVTGTTASAGTINLNLANSTYGVISVQRTDAASVCLPYVTAAGAWYAHVIAYNGTGNVASTSVTLQVDYYAR